MQKIPYNWGLINNVLPTDVNLKLAASFPHDDFRFSEGSGYGYWWKNMFVSDEDISLMLKFNDRRWRQRIEEGRFTNNLGSLGLLWRQLIQELQTDSYRAALSEMSGLDLKDCPMGIGFRRYNHGHTHHPHTDEPNKVLTHLFFLNQQWSANWGGCLRILKNSHPESTFQDILPVSRSSVVIVRSDNSWHMVTPLTSPVSEIRLILRVAFFRDVA
ncbi:2OG-Fe(II) oxygenase [Calothrix sp. UHCC 0171]|uniref:2OG-Fe(II) oxygenase n=1 Tax=Calothrix sp. UHCC 0171 TaxID=3110245 RepID=UPI002B1F15EF|nr:2OG-Fe(II) oxygenase [Calothrix sp. UHCC 0171]MEA5574521.1 2OG-Fe(II) oxygenase [Calothrix sp. UHCC 0171]